MNDDGLDIPEFLKISASRRRAAWRDFKPHPIREQGSIARWQRYEQQRKEEQEAKTQRRIEALRANKGLEKFYDC